MNRWQKLGLLILAVGAIAAGGYYVVTGGRKVGHRWTWMVPEARTKVGQIEREARRQGLDVLFWDGWRDPGETLANIAKGTSKVKDAYGSKHTWGVAFDIVKKNALGLPEWPDKTDPFWQKLGPIGERLGLKWGGRWYNFETKEGFFDGPHFEIPEFNLTVARNTYGANYQGWLAYKGVPIAGATQAKMLA